jgi:abhydrolase domain-containing protein 13
MLYDALGLFQKVRANVLLLDYRGYGLSEGTPSEEGLLNDADAVLDFALLRRDVIDPSKIFLFGRSLGGAVAVHLAVRREAKVLFFSFFFFLTPPPPPLLVNALWPTFYFILIEIK